MVISSAVGTASHTPVTPKTLGNVKSSTVISPNVRRNDKIADSFPFDNAVNAAIVSDVDIILTGDKDFLSLDMEHPKCMTVAQFFASEGVEE